MTRNDPQKDKNLEKQPNKSSPFQRMARPECSNCNEKFHKSPDCPHPKNKIHNIEAQEEVEQSDEERTSHFDNTEEHSLDFQVI